MAASATAKLAVFIQKKGLGLKLKTLSTIRSHRLIVMRMMRRRGRNSKTSTKCLET